MRERGTDREREEMQPSLSPIDLCQHFCINTGHRAILQVSARSPSVLFDCACVNLCKLLFRHNEDVLDTSEGGGGI